MDSCPKRRRQRESRVADGPRRGDMSTSNLHVSAFETMAAPDTIVARLPATRAAMETVLTARREIRDALAGRDRRLMVVAGPCSIHDVDAGVEYARRLAGLRGPVLILHAEKPRAHPLFQADALADALRAKGHPHRLIVIPGSSEEPNPRLPSIKRRVLPFLREHLESGGNRG